MLHFRATYWSRCSLFKAFLTYTTAWKLQGKVSLGCCACWVRAAASKRLFEKPVVKGCALHMGWREERHPSTTVLTYWGWQLLHPPVQKAWAQQALLTGLPWELSGTDSDLGAALWRRTGARLKASLHCVSTGSLCWSSKEVTLWSSLRKGRASHTWCHIRDGGSPAALPHLSIMNARETPAGLLGECNPAAKAAQAAGAGGSSITHSHSPLFKEGTGL